MSERFMALVIMAAATVAVPATVAFAFAAPSAAVEEEGGICTDLGCIGGSVKCADGVITPPSGGSATYTCYTTIRET